MFCEHLLIFTTFMVLHVDASALHGECLKDDHCGTFDTYCKKGTCVCKENFSVVHDTCVALFQADSDDGLFPVPTPPVSCMKRTDCHPILGAKSICKEAQCACKAFHHLYAGQCVKSRSLDEFCDNDSQCYCGEDCQNKIQCVDRICRCKPGTRQFHRRCISNYANVPIISASLLIISSLITMDLF